MRRTALALLLTGIAGTACADSWLYGGISAGASDLDSSSSQRYSIHAGTGILPFIGVEGGYTFHGSFEDQNTDLSAYSFMASQANINWRPASVRKRWGTLLEYRWL